MQVCVYGADKWLVQQKTVIGLIEEAFLVERENATKVNVCLCDKWHNPVRQCNTFRNAIIQISMTVIV
jgi:hypothetical protein